MQKSFQRINIPKLPVLSTEQGINNIKNKLESLTEWKDLFDLIPDNYRQDIQKKRTGLSGIFAASLELTKEGLISMMQKKKFDKILIKKK